MQYQSYNYCPACGAEVALHELTCSACGFSQTENTTTNQFNNQSRIHYTQSQQNSSTNNTFSTGGVDKDWLITLILCVVVGTLGIHNFYNKKIGLGILQLLTAGGCGIWTLVDLIMIAVGKFKNNDNQYLTPNGLVPVN